MSRKRNRRRANLKSTLDLTNLIDVVFALLIIFMITAPMMTQGVQVDLPKAEAKNVETDQKMIQISITKENRIFIDDNEVALRSFIKEFKVALNGKNDTPVFINGDKSVPYGFVIKVITMVQKAGATKLGFLTDPSLMEK